MAGPRPRPRSPQRLTSAARRALDHAGRAARPVDVFRGLAALPTSVAARALEVLGATWSDLGVPEQAPPATSGAAVPDPRTDRLFDEAAEEARKLGHHPIGTGHLVLALLHPNAGPLPEEGAVDYDRFREALKDVLARPWAHGYALDGEVALYVSRDEVLVLYAYLLRRRPREAASLPAERVVLDDLTRLLGPVCEQLLARGLEALDEARRRLGDGVR